MNPINEDFEILLAEYQTSYSMMQSEFIQNTSLVAALLPHNDSGD
jgi:hypothetical protein